MCRTEFKLSKLNITNLSFWHFEINKSVFALSGLWVALALTLSWCCQDNDSLCTFCPKALCCVAMTDSYRNIILDIFFLFFSIFFPLEKVDHSTTYPPELVHCQEWILYWNSFISIFDLKKKNGWQTFKPNYFINIFFTNRL